MRIDNDEPRDNELLQALWMDAICVHDITQRPLCFEGSIMRDHRSRKRQLKKFPLLLFWKDLFWEESGIVPENP